jgi:hypothetical protein
MRRLLVAVLVALGLALAGPASAKTVNLEFKFTPFVGDPAKVDQVTTVEGAVALFLNGVPYAEQPVRAESVPVLFAEREIAPSVWLPVDSLGPAVRKGKNTLRLVFTPLDMEVEYRARLSWAAVTVETTKRDDDGTRTTTNTSAPGKDEKKGKGILSFERTFDAEFVPDVAWHHYPGITSVGDEDKRKLAAFVAERAAMFAPDFADLYRVLAGNGRVEVDKIKDAKCVDAAYAAGVRLDAPQAEQIELVTTGNPEVVIRRKGGASLFMPANAIAFKKIESEEMQMCAGIALSLAFPQRLVVVRAPNGAWQIAY